MANVLSQDEVDSLLGGIGSGSVETETDIPDKSEGFEVYNFGTQAGPINMPGLQMINERFVGFLRNSLSSATGSDVDVKLSTTESLSFNEFCRSLPLPASLNIFKIEPLRGSSILFLEGSLVFSFVETFFGGKGLGHVKLEGRAYTAIESKIIEKISKIILGDLQQAWSDIHKINVVYSHSEVDPRFASIVQPADMVIAIKFIITLTNESGSITFCIPYSTIEPIRDKLKQKFRDERLEIDNAWRTYIGKKVRETMVNLNCILGTSKVSARELMGMKVNDVILLDHKIADSMLVKVEGIPKFKGYPGSYGSKKAIRITERLQKE
jgi:flagellar motor switch protein FliM